MLLEIVLYIVVHTYNAYYLVNSDAPVVPSSSNIYFQRLPLFFFTSFFNFLRRWCLFFCLLSFLFFRRCFLCFCRAFRCFLLFSLLLLRFSFSRLSQSFSFLRAFFNACFPCFNALLHHLTFLHFSIRLGKNQTAFRQLPIKRDAHIKNMNRKQHKAANA